jgi:hypothetical protein
MAGDEIVAEWLGDIYSLTVAVTATPTRFSAVSKRFKSVKIFNPHVANYFFVGQYFPTIAEFETKAIVLFATKTIEFEFIDIYNLAHGDSLGAAGNATLIGINEY